jgi:hypothetical protein
MDDIVGSNASSFFDKLRKKQKDKKQLRLLLSKCSKIEKLCGRLEKRANYDGHITDKVTPVINKSMELKTSSLVFIEYCNEYHRIGLSEADISKVRDYMFSTVAECSKFVRLTRNILSKVNKGF